MSAHVLAIDVSSSALGWYDTASNTGGVYTPSGTLAERCYKARLWLETMLDRYAPDVVALESGVSGGFQGAALTQAEVRGTLRGVCAQARIIDLDVSPTEAKKALTGAGRIKGVKGKDEKRRIIAAAEQHIGRRGISEHEADAVAVAQAARARIVVEGDA